MPQSSQCLSAVDCQDAFKARELCVSLLGPWVETDVQRRG